MSDSRAPSKRPNPFDLGPGRRYNFGRAEITGRRQPRKPPVVIDPLRAAMQACQDVNAGQSFFSTFRQKLITYLEPPYRFYLASKGKEVEAVALLADHPFFKGRGRGLNKDNVATAAVQLATKPTTTAERKSCSELACDVIWAADHSIGEADFARRVSEKTHKGCRDYVREKRRNAKPRTARSPRPWIEIRVPGTDSKVLTHRLEIDEPQYAAAIRLFSSPEPELADRIFALIDEPVDGGTAASSEQRAPDTNIHVLDKGDIQ